jgi:UDP-N-acetylglucosamine 2-epimerase (non-hydrolysing)
VRADSSVVLCVFGTRPEAIKMAPVVRALAAHEPNLRPAVCVTDQHQEMLDQMLEFFGIEPDWRLGAPNEGSTPAGVAARILDRLPNVFAAARPAAVLVQGDTTTAFAAALAAFYARIPVGHVEAGLRTYRPDSPFPEELHRQMTTLLCEWHFAPTAAAREHLLRAGVTPERIAVTGNSVIDSLRWTMRQSRRATRIERILDTDRKIVLVTAHRRESFGAPFIELSRAFRELVERNPDIEIVYPVHPNPEVEGPVRRRLEGVDRLHLVKPLEYWETVEVLRRCAIVLTDSGGLQEEAPALGKPVLVLRETTERTEAIEAGTARLVGTSAERIVREAERLLRDPAAYLAMARAHNPYGDGHAAERVAAILAASLGRPRRDLTQPQGAASIASAARSSLCASAGPWCASR